MDVLVTGASGHVGGNLIRTLVEQGRTVRVLVRRDTRALEGVDVERCFGDICEPMSLTKAMTGVEVVYHLAAAITINGDPDGMVRRTNVDGTRNIVEACLEHGVRKLVHFSSIHAFNPQPTQVAIVEERPLADAARSLAYDGSKADAEREVMAGIGRGLPAVIVNPCAVLGRLDFKPSPMGRVLLKLVHRKLPALVAGGFNWVDVRDVVQGALAAEATGRIGAHYLLGGEYLTVRALADLVGEVSGVRMPRFTCPMWLARVGAPFAQTFAKVTGSEPLFTSDSLHALRNHQLVKSDLAVAELGYRPRSVREAVEDALRWFKDQGAWT